MTDADKRSIARDPPSTSDPSDSPDQTTSAGDGERAVLSAVDLARAFMRQEDDPRPRSDDPAELHERLGIAIGYEGHTYDEVLARLSRLLRLTPSSASSRFFNQLFGGRDPVATLAEMLTPLANTSMYTFKVAGPQVLVEQEVVGRMAAKVGYADGEGMLCPGGSLANLTAMVIARNELVKEARDTGLGGDRLAVYTSEQGHYSIRKNAGIIGIGRHAVREVATNAEGRMDVAALERAIADDLDRGWVPMMVNATAGTTVLGAFDPLREVAEISRRHDLWLHVDGALGGSVLLSEEHRQLLEGSELSDSFTWNAHKMMGVPLPCSALLLKTRGLLARHLNESADYLFQADHEALNPGTRSIQCGRRNDALKLWAAWMLHGDEGYGVRIDRLFQLARHAAELVEADPDLVLTRRPESVNVCFEVRGTSSAEICDRLDRDGALKIGHGVVDGRQAIRLVCVNPDLNENDVARVIHDIKAVASTIREGDNADEAVPRPGRTA